MPSRNELAAAKATKVAFAALAAAATELSSSGRVRTAEAPAEGAASGVGVPVVPGVLPATDATHATAATAGRPATGKTTVLLRPAVSSSAVLPELGQSDSPLFVLSSPVAPERSTRRHKRAGSPLPSDRDNDDNDDNALWTDEDDDDGGRRVRGEEEEEEKEDDKDDKEDDEERRPLGKGKARGNTRAASKPTGEQPVKKTGQKNAGPAGHQAQAHKKGPAAAFARREAHFVPGPRAAAHDGFRPGSGRSAASPQPQRPTADLAAAARGQRTEEVRPDACCRPGAVHDVLLSHANRALARVPCERHTARLPVVSPF